MIKPRADWLAALAEMPSGAEMNVSDAVDPLPSRANTPFDVGVERDGSKAVVRASGELDMATVPALERAIGSLDSDTTSVQLDMRDITFMDSTGLRLLIVTTELARSVDRELSIVPSRAVTTVVDAVGLERFLPLADDGDAH
jgi:anti-sigma B factor antagonist